MTMMHDPGQHLDVWFLVLTKYIKRQQDMANLRATCTSFRDQIDRHVTRDMIDDEDPLVDIEVHPSLNIVKDFDNPHLRPLFNKLVSVPPWSKVSLAPFIQVPDGDSNTSLYTNHNLYSNLYHLGVEGNYWGRDGDFGNLALAEIAPGANHMHSINLCNVLVNGLSPLLNVHTVYLSYLERLVDIGPLRNAHKVVLQNCDLVKDLSPLARCHCVEIDQCAAVTDLSPLANVHRLELTDLNGVTDVSKLGRVHDLYIQELGRLTSLRGLGKNTKVEVLICPELVDVSALATVQDYVRLHFCNKVVDVSSLGYVPRLELSCRVGRQAGLKCLTNNRCLSLTDRPLLEDLSPYSKCQWVDFSNSPKIVDVWPLAKVTRVHLTHCNSLFDVSPLANVQHLNLGSCSNVEDVSALGKVPFLVLSGCHKVKDVSNLGQGDASHLDLSYCEGVKDVSNLGRVKWLDLRYCTHLSLPSLCKLVTTPEKRLTHLQLRNVFEQGFVEFLQQHVPHLETIFCE